MVNISVYLMHVFSCRISPATVCLVHLISLLIIIIINIVIGFIVVVIVIFIVIGRWVVFFLSNTATCTKT